MSAGGYRLLRDSGVIRLPSEQTLCDYTHYIPSQTGFQDGVPEQLAREAKLEENEDWQKYVRLTYDEMKIKKDWYIIISSLASWWICSTG